MFTTKNELAYCLKKMTEFVDKKDTLLHGMLPPSDYKDLHDKCFGSLFPQPVQEEDEEE
jgi:hypothetical protein